MHLTSSLKIATVLFSTKFIGTAWVYNGAHNATDQRAARIDKCIGNFLSKDHPEEGNLSKPSFFLF